MTVRKTFQWTIVLVAVIAAAGWYGLQYALAHKDQLVLEAMRQHVASTMPDWGITIGDAKADFQGRVLLTDVAVIPDPQQAPIAFIPRCLVTLDTGLLIEEKQVLLRSVHVVQPQVHVIRDASGRWNWRKLSRLPSSQQTPEFTIEQGELLVDLAATDGVPETQLASRQVDCRLVPSGNRKYLVEGESRIDGAGVLAFGGSFDLNSGAWRITGRADQVEMSQGLIEKAAALAPDVGRKVAELSADVDAGTRGTVIPGAAGVTPREDAHAVRTASLEHPSAVGQLRLPNLGLAANVGLEFDVGNDGAQDIPSYRILADVMDGTVEEPLSPVPLSNLNGQLLVENGRLVIHDFSASNGASRLSVNGQIDQLDGRQMRDFEIAAEELLIDEELRYLLPPAAQRLFDRLRPSGLFTVRGRFRSDGIAPPEVRLDEFRALDCAIEHQLFAYPVSGIRGTVRQERETLVLDLTGSASGRTVLISGTIRNPGPEAEATIAVEIDDLPIDQRFRDALVDPKHRGAKAALQMLALRGTADLQALFYRPPGEGQPTQMGLEAHLRDGAFSYEQFPYAVSDVSAHVRFDPWKEKVWRFSNVRGRHGDTQIAGNATFDLTHESGGRLLVHVDAQEILLDVDLYKATTTAVPELQRAWVELNPTAGVADVEDVRLTWVPGQMPSIVLPSVAVRDTTLTMPSFPYRWESVTGQLSYADGRVRIEQASARHDLTSLRIEGRTSPTAAYFDVGPTANDASWLLRMENVTVRNLDPGAEFRKALPGDVAATVYQLNPRGPIDAKLSFEVAEFPDPQGGPDLMTSQWQIRTELLNDRLAVGLDLENVTGSVDADIVWNGVNLVVAGWLNFETARALDMTFSDLRGPFRVDDYHVTLGSGSVLATPPRGEPEIQAPLDRQFQASLYGGSVVLNAEAKLSPVDKEQTVYRAKVRFKDGDLREWAREWQIADSGINGTANGALDLEGKGTSEMGLRGSNCWMTVSDARLGELPVIARMLAQMVAPQQRDSTAFRWAYLEFDIRDGMFDFGPTRGRDPNDTRRIVLSGDSLKMVGQGYVPFAPQLDPRMNLDFYSKAPPNVLSGIPFIGPVTKSFSDNWIHVRVSGLPADPRIRKQAEVPVDNALRQFFNAFETGLLPMAPSSR